MSAPRILAQVVILGSQILGKAFVQAWRQAARNAQAGGGAGGGGSGAGQSTAGGAISRTHRMTLDEASQILNVKKDLLLQVGKEEGETELRRMLKNFDHLFSANTPLTPEGKPHSSHYIQSKIVRAKERIEAELGSSSPGKEAAQEAAAGAGGSGSGASGTSP